ncbi:hypothetical protein F442_21745 [Phytophthora nicotianae P10297]|uniref:Uncharacterized protein n=4 Tax=Phytophthora nicotianae TaxID=4792 RepID=W2QW06_PHYN3|nr:hypothetical protein PPTG_21914 [Phytophthora nicotianae INRA-310]ETI31084.1 hypothetical protein F443_21887 [Phytophthora nicotianae P1569]ETK71484.1 hypothetical protein L915_21276 [Phytophthora nicotianae]ETP29044.1 hypothetical protein F442_21745 [Phytophthora nicotianae P10297]ETL78141.1 hypothetical protein L917_21000 [Phytophthora nicotianae]ETM31404.1 hypothetical protein L914_21018 [Phytophthora nicotianae]
MTPNADLPYYVGLAVTDLETAIGPAMLIQNRQNQRPFQTGYAFLS